MGFSSFDESLAICLIFLGFLGNGFSLFLGSEMLLRREKVFFFFFLDFYSKEFLGINS